MNKFIPLLLTIITLTSSCIDKVEEETPPSFDGITMTDLNGNNISVDQDDWHFGDVWLNLEKALFPQNLDICILQNEVFSIVAYPNPLNTIQNYAITTPANCTIYFRLVDKDFNVLLSEDYALNNSSTLSFDFTSFSSYGKLRLYYKVVYNNCELRGHGDIQIN